MFFCAHKEMKEFVTKNIILCTTFSCQICVGRVDKAEQKFTEKLELGKKIIFGRISLVTTFSQGNKSFATRSLFRFP